MDANVKVEAARALGEHLGARDLEELHDMLNSAAGECANASRAELARELRELAGLIGAQA